MGALYAARRLLYPLSSFQKRRFHPSSRGFPMLTRVDGLVLVSDDALLARSVQMVASERCRVTVARSLAEAHKVLTDADTTRAVILDGALFKAHVQGEIAKLRALVPMASMLFVAPQFVASLVNAV